MIAVDSALVQDNGLVDIDLRAILNKIALEGETIDGEPIDPEVAADAYQHFLTLRLRHPERTLVPSALIDLVWHYHILDTRKYFVDCQRIFGGYLHHDPYFGTEGEESRLENRRGWEDTQRLWLEEFGNPMTGPTAHRCSTKDCR